MGQIFGSYKAGINSQIDVQGINPEFLGRMFINVGNNCHIAFHGIQALNTSISIYMNENASIEFGSGQSFNGLCTFHLHEPSRVVVGSNCLWANGTLTSSDYHSIISATTGQRINRSQDIVIGDRVWFGMDYLVLKGAEIGNDSVIAAKSVVTQGIYPQNVILAGNPARIVKENIKWSHALF